jgi:hypothetical protein
MNFISMFHPKRIGATVEMRTASDLSPFEGCFACSSMSFSIFPQVACASNRCRR